MESCRRRFRNIVLSQRKCSFRSSPLGPLFQPIRNMFPQFPSFDGLRGVKSISRVPCTCTRGGTFLDGWFSSSILSSKSKKGTKRKTISPLSPFTCVTPSNQTNEIIVPSHTFSFFCRIRGTTTTTSTTENSNV